MHPAIPHLIELQRVDHQIAMLRAELEGFPKRIREAEAKLGSARADVASAKEAHVRVVAERKKFEFDGQQWKDRARKYRDQSGAVKTNEQVYRCESCGLILYTLEPIPIANPAVGSANTSSTASTNS